MSGPAVPWARGWAALLCALFLLGAGPAQAQDAIAVVERVNDGDTVTVRLAGRRELVRLLGIEAPETGRSAKLERAAARAGRTPEQEADQGRRAREHLLGLAPPGTRLRLEMDPQVPDRDAHGRLLAYLRLDDGRLLNEAMVEAGMARVYRRCGCQALARLSRLEAQARAARRGLRAQAGPYK